LAPQSPATQLFFAIGLAALAGAFWLVFMFALTFTDYLSRSR
jgi:hypothetical protein